MNEVSNENDNEDLMEKRVIIPKELKVISKGFFC